MTIAGYLVALARMVSEDYFYDNSPSRCNPPPYKGRDCSTFVAEGLIDAGYPDINACGNSEYFAGMCYDEPRPDWFTDRYGPGQGTFITHDQALDVVCWGIEGQNFGREAWPGNRAHIETSLGNGGGSVGAHSHATGVGYSQLDVHMLDVYAVPPMFLDEIAPAPTPPQENDMQVFVCPDRPNHPAAHTQFVPAGNPLFPLGALISREGARIAGDKAVPQQTGVRLRVPKGPHGWVACNEQLDGRGLRVLDDTGTLSPPDSFLWD